VSLLSNQVALLDCSLYYTGVSISGLPSYLAKDLWVTVNFVTKTISLVQSEQSVYEPYLISARKT
jgi:hypothetical protein